MKVMKVLKAQQLRETEQIIGSSGGRGPFLPNYFGGIHFRHELFSKDEYRSIYLSSQPTLSFFFLFEPYFGSGGRFLTPQSKSIWQLKR